MAGSNQPSAASTFDAGLYEHRTFNIRNFKYMKKLSLMMFKHYLISV